MKSPTRAVLQRTFKRFHEMVKAAREGGADVVSAEVDSHHVKVVSEPNEGGARRRPVFRRLTEIRRLNKEYEERLAQVKNTDVG